MLSAVSHPSLMSELVKREQENPSTSTFLGRRLTVQTEEFKFSIPCLKLLYFSVVVFFTVHKENMMLWDATNIVIVSFI